MVEVAQGWDWSKVSGISYRRNGAIHHNPDREQLTNEELDKLPFVTEVYENNLDYLKYNSPYCQYPYVSMYTGADVRRAALFACGRRSPKAIPTAYAVPRTFTKKWSR